MQQFITVDTATAELILHSPRKVEIRDPNGKCIGHATPKTHGFTAEDVRISLELLASDEPRYTTAEVKEYLLSLAPINDPKS